MTKLAEIAERWQSKGHTSDALDWLEQTQHDNVWLIAEVRRLQDEIRGCTAAHHAATRLELV